MAGHTEGPWQSQHDFDRDGELTIIGAIDGPDGGHTDFHYTTVCIVEEGEQATANARLIAAAPDFYASAAALIEAWDARTTRAEQIITGKSDAELQRQAMEALNGLRAAIAKARGAE